LKQSLLSDRRYCCSYSFACFVRCAVLTCRREQHGGARWEFKDVVLCWIGVDSRPTLWWRQVRRRLCVSTSFVRPCCAEISYTKTTFL